MNSSTGFFARLLGRTAGTSGALPRSFETLEPRQMMYANGDSSQPVHQCLTEQADNLFMDQFGWSYLTQSGASGYLQQGAHDEDVPDSSPRGHFWQDSAGHVRTLAGGLQDSIFGHVFESAPARAIRYFGNLPAAPSLSDTTTLVQIGWVAHLIEDMTVPAHVLNDWHLPGDADPYHDWVDGVEFRDSRGMLDFGPIASFNSNDPTRRMNYYSAGSIDSGTLRLPSDITTPIAAGGDAANRLVGLMYENAEIADNYDSGDVDGEGPILHDHAGYNAWSRSELDSMARVLVPQAVRSTAEWFRVFFSDPRINADDPVVGFVKLTSKDEARPQTLPNTTVYLDAIATDEGKGNAGVGKDSFEYEFRRRRIDGSGGWSAWAAAMGAAVGPGRHVDDGSTVVQGQSSFAGKHSATNEYTFEAESGYIYSFRAKARDGGGRQGTSEEYFVRVGAGATVVEVIDRSGSMRGAPLDAAKNAARLFADLLQPHDRIGVVAFDDTASIVYSLGDIDDARTAVDAAKSAISSIVDGGSTAIGEGIFQADSMLDSYAGEPGRAIILLSDGQNNAGRDPLSVIHQYVEQGIRIYTIGFGAGADGATLSGIASATGGQYYYAASTGDLQQIYTAILGPLSGQRSLSNQSLAISPGQTRTQSISVPGGRTATFGVNWGGSDLDLTLIDPSGRTIAPTPVTALAEDFTNLAAWTPQGPWAVVNDSVLGGACVTESPSGRYANSMNATLTSTNRIDVPAGVAPALVLRHRYDFESNYDYADVEVSADGSAWTRVARFTGTRAAAREDRVALGGYAGQSVFVRLKATSDSSVTGDGWLIDSISVSASTLPDGVEYITAPTYELFRVANPQPGSWTMSVRAVDVPHADYPFNAYAYNDTRPPLPPRASIADVSIAEGAAGTRLATFTVSLNSSWNAPVSVRYATQDLTAAAGRDYDPTQGVLTIPAGQRSGTFTVPVRGDLLQESAETFAVGISDPTNCTIADGSAVATILNQSVRTTPFGGKTKATYTDAAGKTVTATLSNGSASLVFLDNQTTPFAIRVDSSSASSTLSIASKAPTSLGLITSSTALGALSAKTVSFTSGLFLGGGVKTIVAANIGSVVTLGPAATTVITADVLNDAQVSSSAATTSITARSWTGDRSVLSALALGAIKIAGDCTADITATRGAKSLAIKGSLVNATISISGAIGSFSAGAFRGSSIAISGVIKSLKAGDVNASALQLWNSGPTALTFANVTDLDLASNAQIKSLAVTSWHTGGARDRIVAPSIGTVSSKGDFEASLAVSGAVGSVAAKGSIRHADWRIGGDVKSIAAARIDDTRVFVAVAPDFTILPDSAQQFVSGRGTIGAISCTVGSVDTLISAPTIGTLKLGRLSAAQSGRILGVAARSVKSVAAVQVSGAKVALASLNNPAQSRAIDSLTLRLIPG